MKCGKRKTLILIILSVILIASLAVALTLSMIGKKSEQRYVFTTECTSRDCFFKNEKYKKSIKSFPGKLDINCDTDDCLTTRAVTKSPPYGGRGMCTSKECVFQAAETLRWMDPSIDACENFYNYSCGNFLKTHSLPEGWTSFGVSNLAEEKIALQIKNILEKSSQRDDSDALKRAKTLYKSCLNYSHIEQNSVQDLKYILSGKGVGDWPFMKDEWNDCRLDLEWRMAKLNALGIDSLFGLKTGFKGEDQHTFAYMTVASPMVEGICDDEEENETIARDNALKKASGHIKMVKKILLLLKVDDNNITNQQIEDMFLFDRDFCNVTKLSRYEGNSMLDHTWNETLQDLIYNKPEINWGRWQSEIFSEIGLNFPHEFDIYTHGVNDSIDGIVELVQNTSSRTLANYLTWKFVYHHLGFLASPFQQVVQTRRKYFREFLYKFMDSDRWTSTWHQCVRYIEELVPIAVLDPYLTNAKIEESKREMKYVIDYVKDAFRDVLRKNSFLLRDDIARSVKKVDDIRIQLFYPDKEKKFYDNYYLQMGILGESFIKNGLKVKRYYMKKIMEGVYNSKNRYDLEHTILLWNPFAVNSWSAYSGNQIVISLGGIEPTQISPKLPKFLSMSNLGSTVGQQLTHGFDLAGIKSLGSESYNWTSWPDYIIKYVEDRAKCSIGQYFHHDEEDVSSIDDYLARHQGVHLAYKAYMKYLSKSEENYLPGLSFTSEQLFFIRYAQSQCKTIAAGSDNDPGVTTNRILMNMEEFSKTFKCSSVSGMNPAKKCGRLWE